MNHHNLHHFHIQNHFNISPFFHSSAEFDAVLTLNCVTSITMIFFFFSIIFSISALYLTASVAPPYAHAVERLNALNGDSFQPFRGLSKLWLFFASAFSSLLLFFLITFFQFGTGACVWQVCHCGSLSLFILSLIEISHSLNTKLLTIDRECLFNHNSYSSSLSLPVSLCHAFMCALLLVRHWPSSCGFTALGLHSKRGLTRCVKSFCPWGSQQWAMERWLSPVSILPLTDGYLSPLQL